MKPYQLPTCLRVQGAPPAPAAPPAPDAPPPAAAQTTDGGSWSSNALALVYGLLSIAGTAAGAYHGVARNRGSVWSAVKWGLFGGLAPLITVPIAAWQGFGQPRDQPEETKPDPSIP